MPPRNNIIDQYNLILGDERISQVDIDSNTLTSNTVDGRLRTTGAIYIDGEGMTISGGTLTSISEPILTSIGRYRDQQLNEVSDQIRELTSLVEYLRSEIRELRREIDGSIRQI